MSKVEVEKKFILTPEQKEVLLDGAEKLGGTTIEDTYFDTEDYQLTLNDMWFRRREDEYELKAPIAAGSGSHEGTNRYHEITSLDQISELLRLEQGIDFEVALSKAGIHRFVTCYTNRTSYLKDGFKIDIDKATFANSQFSHAVAEVELLVDDESKVGKADRGIIEFARQHGLTVDQAVMGKIVAYLQAERPKHFKKLVDARVVK